MGDATRAMPRASPVLEADGVAKRRGDRLVLTAASLRARPGEVNGLLGRNGAGKTTLLRILVGLLELDGGSVRLDGIGQLSVRLSTLSQSGVFFLPDRDLLHPGATVGNQLRWMATMHGQAARFEEVCAQLGITARLAQKPAQLSGGERRRAEVACALLRAPRVLVLDEPLRGIAPLDAECILGVLRAFALSGGAVVITGHELPLLEPWLDVVTFCSGSRTHEFASVAAAREDFAFRQQFLGWTR